MITVVVLVYEATTYLFQRISRLLEQYTGSTETATSVDVHTPSVVDLTTYHNCATDIQSELPVSVTESTSESTSESQTKLPADASTSVFEHR